MKKQKIAEILLFILIFLAILSIILQKEIKDLDEIWNYTFAKNISEGIIPYKDFNMLQMPLLPLINGLILKLTFNELVVMRVLAALLCTSILYMAYKIFNVLGIKKEISLICTFILGYLLKDYYCIDYNYATLLVTLIILYNEIIKYKRTNELIKCDLRQDILLGILAGITFTLKQTSGIFIIIVCLGNKLLFVRKKEEFKTYIKSFLYRMIGVIIPITIMLIYIIINGAFSEFISYTFMGTKEFSNYVSYKNLMAYKIINCLAIIVPISFVYAWIKSIILEKDKCTYLLLVYSLAIFVIAFPISDKIHFMIASTIGIILCIYEIYYLIKIVYSKYLVNKKILNKIIKGICVFTSTVIVLFTIFYAIKNIKKYREMEKNFSELNHYKYIPINKNLENQIINIDEYITKSKEKVIILDASASIYMIPIDKYNKNYDMFLKGNLGESSFEKITSDIKNNLETKYLILKDKYKKNWQTPIDIIDFVKINKNKIGEISMYDIYK